MTSDQTDPNIEQTPEDAPSPAAAEAEPDTADEQPDEAAADEDQPTPLKDVVDVDVEDVGTLRKKLTVTVPRSAIDERLDKQYDTLRNEVVVPGFRKGRAPRRLMEKRFGKEVGAELRGDLVAGGYEAAIEQAELKILGEPDIDIDAIELPDEGDLSFSCEVEVRPDVELPELSGIRIETPKAAVSDADVDERIDQIRQMHGQFMPVEDGAVEADDLVVADLAMSAEGVPTKTEANVQLAARAQTVDGIPVRNLGEVLVGARPGEVRTATATVPEDHKDEALRGKTATFELTLRDIKRLQPAELDQEFFERWGVEDAEELRSVVRGQLDSQLDRETADAKRRQVERYLLEHCTLEIPPGLSSRQTERVVQRRAVEMARMGLPQAQIDKQLDELRTTAASEVAEQLKLLFIFEKLAETFDIDVTEDEINGQIAAIAQTYGRRFDRVRDELARSGGLTSLYVRIRDDKVVDRLLADAKVVEAPSSEPPAEATNGGQPTPGQTPPAAQASDTPDGT